MIPPSSKQARFHTLSFTAAIASGGEEGGYVDIIFNTPSGEPDLVTEFGPIGLRGLYETLGFALARLPEFPTYENSQREEERFGPKTKVFFGEEFDVEVIQALGVFLIRVNQLDDGLIKIYSAITGTSYKQAKAAYYASSNMKARLDVIRAISSVSDLPNTLPQMVVKVLDQVKKITDQRNTLFHARWSFRSGRHRATIAKPNAKNDNAEITVTKKMILNLAESYEQVVHEAHMVGNTIRHELASKL